MAKKKAVKKSSKSASRAKPVMKKATDRGDIIEIILEHHKPLKSLIKKMTSDEAKISELRKAFEEFAPQLEAHAKPEEQALYVPMKEQGEDLRPQGFEGDEEHHIADRLVEKIRVTDDEDEFRARVKVLGELVEHHIEEEEEEMFKEVRKEFSLEERVEMGREYSRLHAEFTGARAPERVA